MAHLGNTIVNGVLRVLGGVNTDTLDATTIKKNGTDALPFVLAISGSTYGYKKTDGTFVAFKSQADIDSAVAAAKVGTAVQANVLTGKTFTNSSTSGLSGSMANNSSMNNVTLSAGTLSYTIPVGYHPGTKTVSIAKSNTYKSTATSTNINASGWSASLNCGQSVTVGAGAIYAGTVTAASLSSQTGVDSGKTAIDASHVFSGYQGWVNGSKISGSYTLAGATGVDSGKTAVTAGAMLSGYQGWVNGSKISGTISSKAAATYNTSTSDQTISSGQYLSGNQTIKAVTTSGISAANIKDGTTIKVGDANSATRIANVTGTFTDAATVSSGQTAAAAGQIRSGYSAWVDGAEVKGSIANQAATTYNTSTSDQTIASGKYLSGTQTIKAVTTSGISAANIKTGVTVKVGDANSATRIANVTGTFTAANTVSSGQTAAAAAQIFSGYSAWVGGSEVKGSYTLAGATGVDSGKTAVTAGAMLSGYQGWVNGSKISGTISSKAAATYNTSTSDQTISSGQYISGTQTIKAVKTANISAANIKSGVTVTVGDANRATRIANVAGTFTKANTVSSGQTAAAAGQILSGYSAWVDGAEVKGSYTAPTITSITPSNSSPVSMSANTNYNPSAAGYAISTYSNLTPTWGSSPISLSKDTIYKMGGAGYAISDFATITPSNSNPISLSVGDFYRPDKAGYAILSYESKTPSNSSPVSLSNDSIYKMSAAGYAISSYSSITPSDSSPVSLASGSFYKPSAAGYAISSYGSKTPSNSSPVSLASGNFYKMGGAGYAIASYSSITPSNSSPVFLTSGNFYKMGGNGYAILSYSNITPSEGGQYFTSGMKKMNSSGYAYSSEQKRTAIGTFSVSTSNVTTVTLGFKPGYIACIGVTSDTGISTGTAISIYNSSADSTKAVFAGTSTYSTVYSLPSTATNRLNSVTNTGFTFGKKQSTIIKVYYFAIEE